MEAAGVSLALLASAEDRAQYAGCFACGTENPIGLGLEFEASEDGVSAVFQPRPAHQGWPQALHGGLVATLLDEAAAYVAYARKQRAATARLSIRYHRPAPLDRPLRVAAHLVRATKRLLDVHAEVTSLEGEPLAEAEVTLLLLTESQKRTFGLAGPGLKEDTRP